MGPNGMGGVNGKVVANNTNNNNNNASVYNKNTTFNTLQHNRVSQYAHPSAYPSAARSTLDHIPLLTSKQELSLFLRWLNSVYDGVSRSSGSDRSTGTTNTTTNSNASHSNTSAADTNASTSTTPSNNTASLTPTIDPPLNIRQGMLKHISTHLHESLSHRATDYVVECVRITEYALLCKASSVGEYMNLTTLVQRIVEEVSGHADWSAAAEQGSNIGASNNSNSSNSNNSNANATSTTNSEWRSLITEEIRQDMIFRVEKMLRLVSPQLGINTVEDLNCKIQQYEMGLVVSASSLDEYVDKSTMPKRLAQLVTDFADYKKTLSADQLVV